MIARESTFAPLRRRERERRISALRQRLRHTLGENDCSVWLYSCGEAFGYGSLAQGDWDGFSDSDLVVVAANQDEAERSADQLMEALVGDDVLAIDQGQWQAMAISPSPHWRAIRAHTIRLKPLSAGGQAADGPVRANRQRAGDHHGHGSAGLGGAAGTGGGLRRWRRWRRRRITMKLRR